jgi:membrane fusion protein (multidrug efflux system)
VKKQNITIPVKFSAKMKGETDVMVTPQVSGQLVKICVKEGDLVNRGQTLFVIDSRTARADLEAAQANLLAAQASENSAKLEYQSKKNLFERNIVSRYVLDNAYNSYKQAQAGVAQARAAVNSAQVNLSFCTITASVSGVIGEIPVRMGDQVSPGTQLTILSGNQNMDAEFSITENLLELMIQNGVKASEIQKHLAELPDVTFVMKNGTKYEHKGRVTRMTGVVNATTGTIAAKATFPNPTGLLYSGIQGTVVIPNDMKDVIVIPQVAVVKLQDRQQVYKVLADSTATAVEVTTEDVYNGKDYIVTSGLKVGDKIVTVGANNVHEGQKVLFPKAPKTQK